MVRSLTILTHALVCDPFNALRTGRGMPRNDFQSVAMPSLRAICAVLSPKLNHLS